MREATKACIFSGWADAGGRMPRGAGVRSDESRRREKVAARTDRITESRKRRAAGEKP